MKFIYSNVGDIWTNLVYFSLICYFGSAIDSLRQNKNNLENFLPIKETNPYYTTAYPYNKLTKQSKITAMNMHEHITNWRIYLYKDVMIIVRKLFHLISKIPNFNLEYVDTLYFYLLPIPLLFILSLCTTALPAIIPFVMFAILIYACFFGRMFNKDLPKYVVTYLFPCISLFFMGLFPTNEDGTLKSSSFTQIFLNLCFSFCLSLYGLYIMFENMVCLFGISNYSIFYFMFVLVFSPFIIDGSYLSMLKSLYKHKVSLTFVFILLTLRSSIAKLNSINNPYKNQIIAAEIICGIIMLYLFNKKINSN